MIITIDGYAGSGKSLAAINLAKALKMRLLNTGAMYRAAAATLIDAGIDIFAEPRDVEHIERHMQSLHFEDINGTMFVNGIDMTPQIGSEYAGRAASRIGTFPEVRAKLKAEQRRIATGQSIICEGRDQGTVVFPEAPVKFFFTASVDVRAQRRMEQLREKEIAFDPADIRRQIAERDAQDETRAIDPLKKAADAIAIDTTNLSPDEVLQIMLAAVVLCHSPA